MLIALASVHQRPSLDHISGGRAGWNIVTSWFEQEAWNFSRDTHLDYNTRYERAREFVDVVTELWDSREADAFVHDKVSGRFYDPSKLQTLHHKGKHFSVRRPLSVEPTPQGRPILVQAGANAMGQEIAAADADVVYASTNGFEAAQAYYASVKGRMARYGRDPDHLKIMLALVPIVGRTAMLSVVRPVGSEPPTRVRQAQTARPALTHVRSGMSVDDGRGVWPAC